MPYIKQEARSSAELMPKTSGQLNYAFTCLINYYYGLDPCYQSINDVIGALEGAKLEFYRRVVVPYEEVKRAENGDVYSGVVRSNQENT